MSGWNCIEVKFEDIFLKWTRFIVNNPNLSSFRLEVGISLLEPFGTNRDANGSGSE